MPFPCFSIIKIGNLLHNPLGLIRVPEGINLIFALAPQSHHVLYYYMKPGQPERMDNVLRGLAAAGPKSKTAS
jgi:hypothetical protein